MSKAEQSWWPYFDNSLNSEAKSAIAKLLMDLTLILSWNSWQNESNPKYYKLDCIFNSFDLHPNDYILIETPNAILQMTSYYIVKRALVGSQYICQPSYRHVKDENQYGGDMFYIEIVFDVDQGTFLLPRPLLNSRSIKYMHLTEIMLRWENLNMQNNFYYKIERI